MTPSPTVVICTVWEILCCLLVLQNVTLSRKNGAFSKNVTAFSSYSEVLCYIACQSFLEILSGFLIHFFKFDFAEDYVSVSNFLQDFNRL